MKLIFERETELGRCDADHLCSRSGDWPGEWLAYALTTAALTKTQGLLRIEQRCYLRGTQAINDIRTQPWIQPEMTLEPVLDGKDQTLEIVERLHEQFVQRAKHEFAEQSIIASSAAYPNPSI